MLTPAQRYEFDLKGAVVLRGGIEPELVARLDEALEALEGRGPEELPEGCVPSWTPVINEYRLMGLLETDPVFQELIDRDEVLEWCDEFVPVPYRLAEAYSITRMAGLGVPLHSQPEAKYRQTLQGPRTHLLKVVFNLGDVGPEDGPMVIFEGTHKMEFPFPFAITDTSWQAPGVDPQFEAQFLQEQPDLEKRAWPDIPGYRELHVQAGDVILMSDDLWHGAKALHSGRRRRTLYYSYVPYHYPNWHGIPYSDALKARVTERQRRLLSGPFVGTRYANFDTSDIPDELGFPRLPDSTRDPKRFAAFRGPDPEAGNDTNAGGPAAQALRDLARRVPADPELRGTCRFVVAGDAGGTHALVVDGTGARFVHGDGSDPDTVVEIASDDLLALARSEADPVQLFYEGRARARGDIRLAMRLADCWNG